VLVVSTNVHLILYMEARPIVCAYPLLPGKTILYLKLIVSWYLIAILGGLHFPSSKPKICQNLQGFTVIIHLCNMPLLRNCISLTNFVMAGPPGSSYISNVSCWIQLGNRMVTLPMLN